MKNTTSTATSTAVPRQCSKCLKTIGFTNALESYYFDNDGKTVCRECYDKFVKEQKKEKEVVKCRICRKEASCPSIVCHDCMKNLKANFNPINQFISQEQLDECLKEWQHRLSLNDWLIKASLIDSDKEFANPSEGKHGECHCQPDSNRAMILIKKHDDKTTEEWIEKQPDEIVLVHELLHCKIDLIKNDNTMEGAYYGLMQHKLLEEIAKALIMAKYNLTLDWFKGK